VATVPQRGIGRVQLVELASWTHGWSAASVLTLRQMDALGGPQDPSGTGYDISIVSTQREAVMGRTPGATNRTPRELRAEADHLRERADHIEKTAALKKQLERAKSKRQSGAAR